MESNALFQKLESLVVEALRTGAHGERATLLATLQLISALRANQEKLPSLQSSVSELEEQVAALGGPPLRYGTFLGIAPALELQPATRDPSWSTLEGLLRRALEDAPSPERRAMLQRAAERLSALRAQRSADHRIVVGIQGERYECLASGIAIDRLVEGQRILVNKEMCVVGVREDALVGETAEVVNVLSPAGSARVLSLPKIPDGKLRVQLLSGKAAEIACPSHLLADLGAGDIVQVDDAESTALGRARPRLQVRTSGDQRMAIEASVRLHREGVAIGDIVRIDSRLHIAFEKLPTYETGGLTLEEVPDVSYDDIGGLESQVEEIRDAIELPYIHRSLFDRYRLQRPKGILLHGPPGCGKTMIAKAVANSLTREIRSYMARTIGRLRTYTEHLTARNASGETVWTLERELAEEDIEPAHVVETLARMQEIYRREDGVRSYFLNVKGPELLNKYVGETEQRIRKVFEEAKRRATFYTPVVVFFDEMEAMFRARGSGRSSDVETTIVPQLLSELDGVESTQHIVVIGASNRPELIDGAILRPGRLDAKIKIDRPGRRAAATILALYLTPDLPLPRIADKVHEMRSPAVVFKKSSASNVLKHLGATEEMIEHLLSPLPGRGDVRRLLQDGAELVDEEARPLLEQAALREWHVEKLILDLENLLYHPRSRIEATMISHQRHVIPLHHFVSGAILANIVARAKKLAVKRHAQSSVEEGGLTLADLRTGIEDEFRGSADQLVAERLRGEDLGASAQAGDRVQFSTVYLGDGEQDVWSLSKADIYRA